MVPIFEGNWFHFAGKLVILFDFLQQMDQILTDWIPQPQHSEAGEQPTNSHVIVLVLDQSGIESLVIDYFQG